MLGPIYLHFDGTYNSYHAFSYLQSKLTTIELDSIELRLEKLIVGSDEENALTIY